MKHSEKMINLLKSNSRGFRLIELVLTVIAICIFGAITANILGNASKVYDATLKKQKFVSDEAGAIPKKMKDGEGWVLPSDMGKLKRSDFETEEDYQRYLRQLNRKAEGGLMNLGGI